MQGFRKTFVGLLALCAILSGSGAAFAAGATSVSVEDAIAETAVYLQKTVDNPGVGAVGGEWAVIGLARSDREVAQNFFDAYYENVTACVREKSGVLSSTRYTEYSRVILALTSVGKDPTDVGGYNLLEKLGDYNRVVRQGITGPIFALIALDSGNYTIPVCKDAQVQTMRALLVDKIISQQLPDGGFSLTGTTSDPDITAMALQALVPYREQDDVKASVEKAVDCLSDLQKSDGGYSGDEASGAESGAQVIVALTALGIDPGKDSRFLKGGSSVIDNLMTFYISGGGFRHAQADKSADGMATEQGFYGLVAYERFLSGENALYAMGDAADLVSGQNDTPSGLPGKNPDVKETAVLFPNKTFEDVSGDTAREAIEALASRGIVSGVGDTNFEPGRTMTRAEFAAAVVRALGLTPVSNTVFADVSETSWYAPYAGTANTYGIVTGTSVTEFSPCDTITREQAAVMIFRAAKLCGMDAEMTDSEIRDTLAQFSDYTKSSGWASGALAFCYGQGILSESAINIEPKEGIKRAEVAEMIYIMLQSAKLI